MAILIMHSPRGGEPRYADWLAGLDEGLYLLCSTGHLPVDGAYAEVHAFDNYEVNGAVEIAGLALAEAVPFRRIVAKAECDLLRASRLREALGLPGQSPASALAFRDKVVMKSYLQAAGIAVPAFRRLDDTIDLIDFARSYGYPVLVKPVDGSGSSGIRVLGGALDVDAFVHDGLPRGFEVEEVVEGQLYHVDGLVLGGEIVVIQSSRYVPPRGSLAVKDDLAYGSYSLGPLAPLAARLDRFVDEVLETLPSPRDFTFHAEVFHTPADRLVFCEIASRTGGCLVKEMLCHGLGVDVDALWIQAQCGLPPDASALRTRLAVGRTLVGRMLLPPRRGRLVAIPDSAPDWVLEYHCRARPGDAFLGAAYDNRKTGDYVAACLVEGESEGEVEQRLFDAAKWLDESSVWAPA